MEKSVVAVLAVQGAFIEHERRLEELGARCVELRQARDLEQSFDRLVLPGGESTVQGKLLRELGMFEPLRQRILAGMPVLATCAGLILLAEHIEGGCEAHLGTLAVTVRRNAYGRQLGSFHTQAPCAGIDPSGEARTIPMTFIRAPFVSEAHGDAQVLAEVDGRIVAVRQGRQLACAFHPELDPDPSIHELFLRM